MPVYCRSYGRFTWQDTQNNRSVPDLLKFFYKVQKTAPVLWRVDDNGAIIEPFPNSCCFPYKMCEEQVWTVFSTKCEELVWKQSAYITPAYEKRRMTMAPISGSTDGEETKTEEAKWRRGQSWNPNYSIIAPKSGPDSIYPVPPSTSSSSPSSLIYNENMH